MQQNETDLSESLESLKMNGYQIYHGFLSGYMNILGHKDYMNQINVFPVPDGDTGNNMIRTFRAVLVGVASEKSASHMLDRIARRSLEGARGNSGMILSQFMTGFSLAAREKPRLTMQDFGRTVKEAVRFAYEAMDQPREGTILTVIRVWAETVDRESRRCSSLKTLLSRAFAEAQAALAKTTDQLPILKENRVVDAGAWGFVSFLEGIEKMHRSGPVPFALRRTVAQAEGVSPVKSEPVLPPSEGKPLRFRYCTEVLLDAPRIEAKALREELQNRGDSLIVGRGRDRLRVHIHTDDPAGLVGLLTAYGEVAQQKVDDMRRQEEAVNRRLGTVAVLTDSIADISQELLDRYQIHQVNLPLLWENEEFLDRLTITPEEFYRQQAFRKGFPSSSVPDRSRTEQLFQFLMDHYDSMIVLPVASALSGTRQLLAKAAEPYNRENRRIEVIDTCLNSAAQGLLTVEVARRAAAGTGLEELTAAAEELKKRMKIYVSVETFKFMVKGGRVSPLKGFAAGVLRLKPIVSLDETGRGIALDKAFSRDGLLKKIARILRETQRTRGILRYVIVHAAAPEKAREFARLTKRITGEDPLYISAISPVVGMHSGKGAVAIGLLEGPA